MYLWDSLHLGPLNLPLWIPATLVGYVAMSLTLQATFKGPVTVAKDIEDSLTTSGLIFLVIWKISPLFDASAALLTSPWLVLYLPGNVAGVVVGFLAACGWFIYQFLRRHWEVAPTAKAVGAAMGAGLLTVMIIAFGLSFFPKSETTIQPGPTAALLQDAQGGSTSALLPDAQTGASPTTAEPPGSGLVLKTVAGPASDVLALDHRLLVLNFWATWCPPCRAEIPGLLDFWKRADRTRVNLRTVNLTTTEQDPSQITTFLREQTWPPGDPPVFLDEKGTAAARFKVETIPTTVVIRPDGRVVVNQAGVVSRDQLEAWIRQYGSP